MSEFDQDKMIGFDPAEPPPGSGESQADEVQPNEPELDVNASPEPPPVDPTAGDQPQVAQDQAPVEEPPADANAPEQANPSQIPPDLNAEAPGGLDQPQEQPEITDADAAALKQRLQDAFASDVDVQEFQVEPDPEPGWYAVRIRANPNRNPSEVPETPGAAGGGAVIL